MNTIIAALMSRAVQTGNLYAADMKYARHQTTLWRCMRITVGKYAW